MNKIKENMSNFKFLAIIFILTFTISCGQQKRYVSYKVKKDETMRTIAKRLGMKTKDLLRLNPDVGRRPAENTVIIIPNKNLSSTSSKEETESTSTNNIEETNTETTPVEAVKDTTKIEKVVITYQTHTVAKGETVWALTQKYNISKDELIKLNPEVANSLRKNQLAIGQTLNIKATETKSYVSLEEELKDFVTHQVQPKETMYSITRFYNISKDELVALNSHLPNLKDNLLSIGDILKIKPLTEKTDLEIAKIYTDSIQADASINLALLFPFKAKKYDSISPVGIFGKGKKSKLANIVTDYYMGAQIAIDSIKKQGINVNVKVFDTGNRGENVSLLLADDKLENSDAIIGPFYFDKAETVAKRVDVPVVYPIFSKNQHKFTSGKIVKTTPDIKQYAATLSSYLKNKYTNETIFVVGDGKTKSNNLIQLITATLKENDSIKEIVILKPEKNYIKKNRFTNKMQPNAHCWVIMTSDDNAIVADALNSMVVLPEKVTAQVFSVDKNDAYNTVDNNKLARIQFSYVTDTFINEQDTSTKQFNNTFKRLNFTNPSEYAIKGFDVTYDILARLASGNKLSKTFKQGASIRVGNKFEYNKKLFGATNNNGLFIVQYNNDLSLKRLR